MALLVDESWIDEAERSYPGFRKDLAYAESRDIPLCTACGSANTARVGGGLIGRTMHLAAATTKFKLVPNNRLGDVYCNACDRFFDAPSDASSQA